MVWTCAEEQCIYGWLKPYYTLVMD